MILPLAIPVPGLTRDLLAGQRRGPGSGPGRDLPFGNHAPSRSGHGAFRLHHGIAPRRCPLHRAGKKPAHPHRVASRRPVGAYREIPDQDAGLVRGARRFRNLAAQGAGDQALAAGLEDRADHLRQPRLARHDRAYPGLRAQPAPGQTRGLVAARRQPVPGLTRDPAATQPTPVPALTRDLAHSGGCHIGVKEVPAQGRDGWYLGDG